MVDDFEEKSSYSLVRVAGAVGDQSWMNLEEDFERFLKELESFEYQTFYFAKRRYTSGHILSFRETLMHDFFEASLSFLLDSL